MEGENDNNVAMIEVDANKLDADNYLGNTINLGLKYSSQEFTERMYPNIMNHEPHKFQVPR